MKTASWIVLVLAALLLALASLGSISVAYFGQSANDIVSSTNVQELAAGRTGVEAALRGRRGTAASFALAFAVLFTVVVMGPYRRGEVWAWWALLCATAVLALGMLLRIPLIHTRSGAGTGGVLFLVVVVGLLLDVRRLVQRRP